MGCSIQMGIDELLLRGAEARQAASEAAEPAVADELFLRAERLADAAWSLGEQHDVPYVPCPIWTFDHAPRATGRRRVIDTGAAMSQN